MFITGKLKIMYKIVDFLDRLSCASSPCLNDGNCTGDVTNYTCTCANEYTGMNCETGKTIYVALHLRYSFFFYVHKNKHCLL